MSQHDMNIANQAFPAFRTDLNNALAALVSNSAGGTAPTTTFAHQFWVDTAADPSVLKVRNADNDAWITIGQIDQTNDKFTLRCNNATILENLTLNAQGDLRFADSDSSNYVAFQAPSSVASNVTWTLPSADGTSGQALTTDGAGTLSWAAGTPSGGYGFRNRIINGDMRIDQRNAGAAVTTSSAFSVDRFIVVNTTGGAFSIQQDSSAPVGFVNSIKWTVTTADSTLTTTERAGVIQRIEGQNVSDLAWGTASAKTVTISFWVRSSVTGTFGGSLVNDATDRSYPFTYSISAANTWEQKSVTIAGDTSGTWLTTSGIGIRLEFSLGAGPDRSGTAGAWAGATYFGATGETNLMATLNATWYITGVQLEVGSVATEFERRPYGTELALCQRYFQTWGGVNNYEQMPFFGIGYNSSTLEGTFTFIQTMRAAPTLSTAGTLGFLDVAAFYSTGTLILDSSGLQTCRIRTSTSSGLTQFRPYQLVANNSSTARLQLSAEL